MHEPLEEEKEEMTPVTAVERKDQTGTKMQILKKKMGVVLPQLG